MRILFLSGCAPAKYNYREPNAYPFYLIKEFAAHHQTGVLYFNANKKINIPNIESELKEAGVIWLKQLNANKFIKTLLLFSYLFKAVFLKLFIRLGLPFPSFIVPLQLSVNNKFPEPGFTKSIKEFAPDLVIVFPIQLFFAIKKISKLNIPVSVLCTDSASLHFFRQLKVINRIEASRYVSLQMLAQAKKLEKTYRKIGAHYFFVGEKDKESFVEKSRQNNNSFFIPHHLYSGITGEKKWDVTDGRLNVLFGGDGHTIYVGDEVDKITEEIAISDILNHEKINFFFLGNRYDKAINTLQKAGYSVVSQVWAEDYDEYIKKMHVQIFPIILGTGTKAKVLAAMVSGLLCVGTSYAFENIAARYEDYLLYDSPADVPGILADVCINMPHYERIAIETRKKILTEHNTSKVANIILDISAK